MTWKRTPEEVKAAYVNVLAAVSFSAGAMKTGEVAKVAEATHQSVHWHLIRLLRAGLVTERRRYANGHPMWGISESGRRAAASGVLPASLVPQPDTAFLKQKPIVRVEACVVCKRPLDPRQKTICASPVCGEKYEKYLTPSLAESKETDTSAFDMDPAHGDDVESKAPARRILTRDGTRRPNS